MTQETNRPRIVIDTNKHGIRRETNLTKLAKKAQNKRTWQKDPNWKKKIKEDDSK
jgi:hypothetical protein